MGRMVEQTEAQRIELSSALVRFSSEQNRPKRRRRDRELITESRPTATSSESRAHGSLTRDVTRRVFD